MKTTSRRCVLKNAQADSKAKKLHNQGLRALKVLDIRVFEHGLDAFLVLVVIMLLHCIEHVEQELELTNMRSASATCLDLVAHPDLYLLPTS